MKFDVVIGNPPYNNDLYLDFVQLGYKIARYECMITPAKWQAKGGIKNEAFRRDIVPHMRRIVYYPNAIDVFDIALNGGISYYIIKNNVKFDKIDVSILGKQAKTALVTGDPVIYRDGNCIYLLVKNIADIIDKVKHSGSFDQLVIAGVKYDDSKINVKITGVFSDVKRMNKNPSLVLIEPYIDNKSNDKNIHTSCIRVCNTYKEAESFISYVNTRFVRFLVFLNAFNVSIINDETWRFVPDPGEFDHIFTYDELYKKYGLTQEEIAIIESVVKVRNSKYTL